MSKKSEHQKTTRTPLDNSFVRFGIFLVGALVLLSGLFLLTYRSPSFPVPSEPWVAYLGINNANIVNVYLTNPTNLEETHQLTYSPIGISDFGFSTDGTQLAYTELSTISERNIFLLNLADGSRRQLTNCVDSECMNPVWSPDNSKILFERHSILDGYHIWVIDFATEPAEIYPLIEDEGFRGHSPQWSADGKLIAYYDPGFSATVVFDFAAGTAEFVNNPFGVAGALSPDGKWVVFAQPVLEGTTARHNLRIAGVTGFDVRGLTSAVNPGETANDNGDNIHTHDIFDLTNLEDPINDTMPTWNPNGSQIAFVRQYMDERYTRGSQVHLLDIETGEIKPLFLDARYANGFMHWDISGTQLVIQRFPELDAEGNPGSGGTPEVWVYDLDNDELTLIEQNAYLPRWVGSG